MDEVQVKTLEIDGHDYILIDTIESDGQKYYYFVQEDDNSDIQILKETTENDEEILISLDNEQELDKAMILFSKKYNENTSSDKTHDN